MKLIPKLQTAWQPINQQAIKEWSDNWKSRTTKSRVLQGRGVESDKEYTERRKRETAPQRTWLSDAADVAHGVREVALAMHPLTAIPYFGAKVGQDFLNGNVSWQTAVNATVPLFHFTPTPSASTVINSTLEDLANAGSKTARNIRVARELKNNVKQTKLTYQEYAPTIRTRVGDVEVDNPNLFYRVGTKDIVEDFNKTGKVRAGETNHQNPISSGGISLKKHTYPNPMFKEGSLWYQPSEEINGLLVSNGKFQYAGKHSTPINYDMGRRRIPAEELNSSNTTAYIWKPSYGYKKVQQKPSTTQFSEIRSASPRYGKPVNIDKSPNVMSIEQIKQLKQSFPSYAKPNWGGDPLNLTKERFLNGGFERLLAAAKEGTEGQPSWNFSQLRLNYSPYLRNKLVNTNPLKGTSLEVGKALKDNVYPDQIGVAIPFKGYSQILDDTPAKLLYNTIKPKNNRNIAAHEFSHYIYTPTNYPKGFKFKANSPLDNYFTKNFATEVQARGTQLKNYFGLKEGEDITPEMWKYAKQRYIKALLSTKIR